MAEVTPPLYLAVDTFYGADELARPIRDLMGEGVVGASDLAVSEKSGSPTMSVDIAVGACYVKGDTSSAQPTYRCHTDSVINRSIAGADATNPRIDLVLAEVRDSTFSGAFLDWRIRVQTGVPAASPVAPAVPSTAIPLALVRVDAGVSSIVNAKITDMRPIAHVGGGDASGIPSGALLPFGGVVAPFGYLLCDGAAVSRTRYATLFAVLGTAYGAGDGTNTFNVPDLRARVPVGEDGAAGRMSTNDARGQAGGEEKHTLSIPEIPAHSHGGQTGTNATSLAHTHQFDGSNFSNIVVNGGSGFGVNSGTVARNTFGASADLNHVHPITAEGGGGEHNNMQPYQVVGCYIVKA